MIREQGTEEVLGHFTFRYILRFFSVHLLTSKTPIYSDFKLLKNHVQLVTMYLKKVKTGYIRMIIEKLIYHIHLLDNRRLYL